MWVGQSYVAVVAFVAILALLGAVILSVYLVFVLAAPGTFGTFRRDVVGDTGPDRVDLRRRRGRLRLSGATAGCSPPRSCCGAHRTGRGTAGDRHGGRRPGNGSGDPDVTTGDDLAPVSRGRRLTSRVHTDVTVAPRQPAVPSKASTPGSLT